MQAPTSRYGCGSLNCVPCSGDEEWQESRTACIHCGEQLLDSSFEDVTLFVTLENFEDWCEGKTAVNGRHVPRYMEST